MKHCSLLFSILTLISLVTNNHALAQTDFWPNGVLVLTFEDKQISLIGYNLLGREVATLVNEKLAPGEYTCQWDAAGFASGVYFYELRTGAAILTKKPVVLR